MKSFKFQNSGIFGSISHYLNFLMVLNPWQLALLKQTLACILQDNVFGNSHTLNIAG